MSIERYPDLVVLPSPADVAERSAELFVDTARRAQSARGRFSVALAGGSTPERVYRLLATEPWVGRLDWTHVDVFWGDERCVPPDSPESNFGRAHAWLLRHVPIDPSRVHRIRGEWAPARAAAAYERELRTFASDTSDAPEVPPMETGSPVVEVGADGTGATLDLVLLGLGTDGHTASIFPGTSAWQAELEGPPDRWVLATVLPDGLSRVTLTSVPLNRARQVLFVVTGASKRDALARVLAEDSRERLPAQIIRPTSGRIAWYVDEAAAGR